MSKEELKPIDVSKYTVTESGNVIKSEEKETTNKELEKRAFAEADKVVISVVHLRHLLKNMYVGGAIGETKLLSQHILDLQKDKGNLTDRVRELEQQIEKLIDFVLSKTECCDVCPITDTCINSEGTCPYAGILAKGEEEVTREWLMQKIAKEIKEND